MTDREIELNFALIEEQINSKIDRIDGKLERLQLTLDDYKEAHSNEHDHNTNETNLKLDLINERIITLQDTYKRFEKQEQLNESKSLGISQISWAKWGIFIGIAIFFFSNFFNINYETTKKYFDNKVDNNTTVGRDVK